MVGFLSFNSFTSNRWMPQGKSETISQMPYPDFWKERVSYCKVRLAKCNDSSTPPHLYFLIWKKKKIEAGEQYKLWPFIITVQSPQLWKVGVDIDWVNLKNESQSRVHNWPNCNSFVKFKVFHLKILWKMTFRKCRNVWAGVTDPKGKLIKETLISRKVKQRCAGCNV